MADNDQMMQICAFVPAELVRALDTIAERKGLKRARAIEQACSEYVRRETPFACPGCKAQVVARMRFCSHCGTPLSEEDARDLQHSVEEARAQNRGGGVNG